MMNSSEQVLGPGGWRASIVVDEELARARHGLEGARRVYKQLGFVRSVAAVLCVLSFSAVVRAEPRFLFCLAQVFR